MPDETTDRIDDAPDLVVDDGDLDEPDEEWTPPRDRSREAALAAAGLSVLAGVLCVIAPFRSVYTLRAQGISLSFDGWGRYDLASGSQHGPRYGVALTVVALVLVVAAATRLRDLRPVAYPEPDVEADAGSRLEFEEGTAVVDETGEPTPSTEDRLAAGIGVAGSALLLGVLGSVALSIESTVSNSDAIAATPGGTATSVDVGGMLWFLVGAWVVSVAAVYLPWFEARRRS